MAMLSTEGKLTELVNRLKEVAGDNLESVVLYGSAARAEARRSYADLNVLCTLRSASVSELARVAPVVRWWCKDQREPAPLFFTAEELRQSADVFAIELLDMQKGHRVLFGRDVVADIAVPMNLHRIQVEHDLRTLMLKLRQHFLLATANEAELKAVMAKSISSALALLRHTLIAYSEEPPSAPREVFARIARLTGAEAAAFETLLELRESDKHVDDIPRVYGRYLNALDKVTSALDNILPKKEWRRAREASS